MRRPRWEVGVTESLEVAGLNWVFSLSVVPFPSPPPPGTFFLKEEGGEEHVNECENVY